MFVLVGSRSSAASATAWSGTARTLASVLVHLSRPLREGAADVGDPLIGVDVALLEGDPLAGAHAGSRGEQHHRAVPRPEPCRDRVEFGPRLERALLSPPPLRIVNALLGGVPVEQSPDDSAGEHLAQRLGRLEPVSGRDRHPPRGDLLRAQLPEPQITELSTALPSSQRSFSTVTAAASC